MPFDSSLVLPTGYSFANSALIIAVYLGDIPIHAVGNITHSVQSQLNIVDSMALVRGRHQFKFGVDWRRLSPVVDRANYTQQVLFSLFSGDIADTIAGNADYLMVQSAQRNQQFVYDNYSLFGQDTWRVTPRTTLTYGLRWDYNPTPHAGEGTLQPYTLAGVTDYQDFDATANLTLAPLGTPIYHASRANFAPRVGIAQRLHESDRFGATLRGGFGVFYDLVNTPVGSITGFPYSAQSLHLFVPYPPDAATIAPPALNDPTYPISSLTAIDANLKTPYTLQWNVTYEQQLGTAQTATFSYVGAAGRNLLRTAYYTGINPNFDDIQVFTNGGTSDYNSFQAEVQRQLSHGLQVLASYTLAHAIDTESQTQGSQPPSRASSDYDIRHIFSAALNYDLPKPQWNAFARTILGDWSAHTLIIARSAPPVELVAAFPTLPFSYVARLDVVPGQPFYINDPTAPGGHRFNPDAFTFPPDNQQGTLWLNALRGFGATQIDLALDRKFQLHESVALRFRADIFNLFNHPNFGPPDRRLYSTDFGYSKQTLAQSLGNGGADGGFSPLYQIGGARSVQLSLRLEF